VPDFQQLRCWGFEDEEIEIAMEACKTKDRSSRGHRSSGRSKGHSSNRSSHGSSRHHRGSSHGSGHHRHGGGSHSNEDDGIPPGMVAGDLDDEGDCYSMSCSYSE
jgi:hypothetical protein